MRWTVQEAAEEIGISGARIRFLCKQKRIKCFKRGYDWVITSLKVRKIVKKKR